MLNPPLGAARLKVVEYFLALTTTGFTHVVEEMVKQGVFDAILVCTVAHALTHAAISLALAYQHGVHTLRDGY